MKTRPFTFKKATRPTGIASVGWRAYTTIKLAGCYVGLIHGPEYRPGNPMWSVRFMTAVEPTKEFPCPFEWRDLGRLFDSEDKAREWLAENAATVHGSMRLYSRPKGE